MIRRYGIGSTQSLQNCCGEGCKIAHGKRWNLIIRRPRQSSRGAGRTPRGGICVVQEPRRRIQWPIHPSPQRGSEWKRGFCRDGEGVGRMEKGKQRVFWKKSRRENRFGSWSSQVLAKKSERVRKKEEVTSDNQSDNFFGLEAD
jgi:hypothetical protein